MGPSDARKVSAVANSKRLVAPSASCWRTPEDVMRVASHDPIASASVIAATSSVTPTGSTPGAVFATNAVADTTLSTNAAGSTSANSATKRSVGARVAGAGEIEESPLNGESPAGGSTIAHASARPAADNTVSTIHPAPKPHSVTIAPPATTWPTIAVRLTARVRA